MYWGMDSIAIGTMRPRVERFIAQDLLKRDNRRVDAAGNVTPPTDYPCWAAGEWEKEGTVYFLMVKWLVRQCCSMAQMKRVAVPDPNMHHTVRENVLSINFENDRTPAQIQARMENVVLPGYVRKVLDQPPVGLRTVVVFFATTGWSINNEGNRQNWGHASAMVFDLRRKLQILYDPQGGSDRAITRISCAHQFHPRFAVANVLTTTHAHTLQSKLQGVMFADDHGMCGILTLVMLMVSARFNLWNPTIVASILYPILSVGGRGNMLITWYDQLLHHYYANDRTKLNRCMLPPSAEGRCNVYSPSTGRLCSRKSCSNGPWHAMCWQHRWIVRNKASVSRKCVAPQAPCVQAV